MKIGIFDSGIGGLNMLVSMIKVYPQNEYFYYADNKNIPYGNKDYYFIKQNVFQAMDYFLSKRVEKVILACNTVSTMLGDLISSNYPFIFEKVQPNLQHVLEYDRSVLLATNNTIIYTKNHLNKIGESIGISASKLEEKVSFVPLSNLASMTEKVAPNFYENFSYIRDIVKYIPNSYPIILGCTHYTFYQKYLESLGYTCFSEVSLLNCQYLCEKNTNNFDKFNLNNNLIIKLTDTSKINLYYRIINRML